MMTGPMVDPRGDRIPDNGFFLFKEAKLINMVLRNVVKRKYPYRTICSTCLEQVPSID